MKTIGLKSSANAIDSEIANAIEKRHQQQWQSIAVNSIQSQSIKSREIMECHSGCDYLFALVQIDGSLQFAFGRVGVILKHVLARDLTGEAQHKPTAPPFLQLE